MTEYCVYQNLTVEKKIHSSFAVRFYVVNKITNNLLPAPNI